MSSSKIVRANPLAPLGGRRVLWRGANAVAAAMLVFAFFTLWAINSEYHDRLARDEQRMPAEIFEGSEFEDHVPVAAWTMRSERLAGEEVTVEWFLVDDPSAPPPPGAEQWPRAGQVIASPGTVALEGSGPFLDRFGNLIGEIDPRFLADPGERIVYAGVDRDLLNEPGYWLGISGFGVSPSADRGDQGMIGSALYQLSPLIFYLGFSIFIGAPVALLTVVAARLGGEDRRQTLAVMHAIGASRRQLAAWIVQAIAAPAVLGIAVAVSVGALIRSTGITVPIVGYEIAGKFDFQVAATFLIASFASFALVLLVNVWPVRSVGKSWLGARPNPTTRSFSLLWVGGLVAALAITNWGYALLFPTDPKLAMIVLFVGTMATLGLLAPSSAALFQWFGRGLAHCAHRSGAGVRLVAGRELQTLSGPIARATVFAGIAVVTTVFAVLLVTQPSHTVVQVKEADALNADRTLLVGLNDGSESWVGDFSARLPANVQAVGIVEPRGDGTAVQFVAACTELEGVFGTCPPVGQPASLAEVQAAAPPELALWGFSDGAEIVQGSSEVDDLLLVSTSGEPIDRGQISELLNHYASPTPAIASPVEGELLGAEVARSQARWQLVGGAIAVSIALLAGVFALTWEVVRVAERLSVVRVFAGCHRDFFGLAFVLIGMPLLLGVTVGAFSGLLLSVAPTAVAGYAPLDTGPVVAVALAFGALTAAAATIVGGLVLQRWKSV